MKLKQMSTKLNEDCFDDLSEIIKDWSMENSIDMVLGKMEVVFNTKQFEITDDIVAILKEKDLFIDGEL
jgi:Skp family chaperone for outer membrane proteins